MKIDFDFFHILTFRFQIMSSNLFSKNSYRTTMNIIVFLLRRLPYRHAYGVEESPDTIEKHSG